MDAGAGDDRATVGMPDQHASPVELVDHPGGCRDVRGEIGHRQLDHPVGDPEPIQSAAHRVPYPPAVPQAVHENRSRAVCVCCIAVDDSLRMG